MANDIGSVTSVNGTSMGHNSQSGVGGQKPAVTGNSNPGGCKPPKPADGPVPMPK